MAIFFAFLLLISSKFYYFLAFGRFVPYLERRCERPSTPAVSSAPRTIDATQDAAAAVGNATEAK